MPRHRPVSESQAVVSLVADALRTARATAGVSQAELARRSGVPRTVIVEVERGRRQPSMPTLARLLAGTGLRPTVGLVPLPLRHSAVGRATSDTEGAAGGTEGAAPTTRPPWSRPAPDDRRAATARATGVLDALSLADAIRLGKQQAAAPRR